MASSDRQTVDAVRAYLTGAGTHGGAQADPDASTGGHQSSTRAMFLSAARGAGLSNITIDFVGGGNGPGQGTLTATGANALTWAPPGEDAGDAVTIANGETHVVHGEDPGRYVVVTRTSAAALSGSCVVTLADQFGNVLGMDSVSSAEATSGVELVRLLSLRNDHAGLHEVKDLKVWLEPLEDTAAIDGGDGAHTTVLGGSGSGTIALGPTQPGRFSSWPESGWVLIENAAGSAREIAYYTSRTDTVLTIPAAGRGLSGTSARAGVNTDKLWAWCGATVSLFEAAAAGDAYPDEEDVLDEGTWAAAHDDETALEAGNLVAAMHVGVGVRCGVPAGAVATPGGWARRLRWAFDTVW